MTGYTGVNLLIGTENGLVLLDRSGQGKSEFSLSHTCLCLSPVTPVCLSVTPVYYTSSVTILCYWVYCM